MSIIGSGTRVTLRDAFLHTARAIYVVEDTDGNMIELPHGKAGIVQDAYDDGIVVDFGYPIGCVELDESVLELT